MFDSLPNQVTTRRTIHGISFNLLVVGPTGIGKTTLINSLFDCIDYTDAPDLDREVGEVSLKVKEEWPENKTIKMKITIIETKGFGNQLDRSLSYMPIVDYIDDQFESYMKNELEVQENRYDDITDNRVHCLIYMISPTGPGLKPIDIATMKKLHQKVCLIPVIGKSDILTKHERQALKEKIRQELILNSIDIYSSEEHLLPIAIAASNEIAVEGGKRQRVRTYPWGKICIERDTEFSRLRELVLTSNMLSLVEHTARVHYDRYRMTANSEKELEREELEFEKFKSHYNIEKKSMMKEIGDIEFKIDDIKQKFRLSMRK